MNPLLLKPESDTRSQVVLLGRVHESLSRMAWRDRSATVWPVMAAALDELRAENDVIVIEGAGSPAEINLKDSDVVNMRVAQHAHARCLLVADIDRGGAFAHLYGTWALLSDDERQLIRGFVLNKFRGDAALLAPGPHMLRDLTGIATWRRCRCGGGMAYPKRMACSKRSFGGGAVTQTMALVAYPRISNLDEFQPLKNVPGLRLVWARSPADLALADCIILPGSKHTSSDLSWMRSQGLDRAIAEHAGRGGRVLGICGGLQMLGEALIDAHGIDGNGPGLGLLPLITHFAKDKTVRHTHARFGQVAAPWAALSRVAVSGYEIRHGHTGQPAPGPHAQGVMPDGLAWQNAAGNVLGLYLHGLFESPTLMQTLFGQAVPTLDTVFEGMADFIERHFEPGALHELLLPDQA